jgi:hypothetical protein
MSGPNQLCLFDLFIRDGKKSGSGSEMNNLDHISELGNNFFLLKYLNSLMRLQDPGWKKFVYGIRNGKNSYTGSGMEKIRIRDKHPRSEILDQTFKKFFKFLVPKILRYPHIQV